MGCLSASGESVLPLWVFKGRSRPYRTVDLPNGTNRTESVTHLLATDSISATRQGVGGVDSAIF